MSFSCKIILSEYKKADGMRQVLLQAIIDRKRAKINLGFYIHEHHFDAKRQCIKRTHPNAKEYEAELYKAVAKANSIASKYRLGDKLLTPEEFRNEYIDPSDGMDLIKFISQELELKRASISENTYKQHTTVLNRLRLFKKSIPFKTVSIELMQKFRTYLIKDCGNMNSTVEKLMKIVKQYINDARNKGITVSDPFKVIKIKTFKSNRSALSEEEVKLMQDYFDKPDCPPKHKKLLRYFLFSCFTGIRISDISAIKWNNIHGDLLIFTPTKTRNKQQTVTVPLRPIDKQYLPEFRQGNVPIFDTFSDPKSNEYIKEVADELKIKKHVTYHTSRHTFGSLFADGDGNIVALQKMMGHSDIKTTMGYVHTSAKSLVKAKKKVFG
jgi:integrase/recombinase XerD